MSEELSQVNIELSGVNIGMYKILPTLIPSSFNSLS